VKSAFTALTAENVGPSMWGRWAGKPETDCMKIYTASTPVSAQTIAHMTSSSR
jgi:hypothetical protein